MKIRKRENKQQIKQKKEKERKEKKREKKLELEEELELEGREEELELGGREEEEEERSYQGIKTKRYQNNLNKNKEENEEINKQEEEEEENNQINSKFYFENYKPIKNTNKRFILIAEENAKEALKDLNIQKEITSQRLSRLYCTGSDSNIIINDIKRKERKEITLNLDKYNSYLNNQVKKLAEIEAIKGNEQNSIPSLTNLNAIIPNTLLPETNDNMKDKRIFQLTNSLYHSTKEKYIPQKSNHSEIIYNQFSSGNWKDKVLNKIQSNNPPQLRTHTALSMLDNCSQGQYHIPITVSPYQERFEGLPQESSFTKTIPGKWNIEERKNNDELYVRELNNGKTHCSKSISNQDGLSTLQSSLIACGKLVTTENQNFQQIETKIQKSILESGIRHSKQHAQWLLGLAPSQSELQSELQSQSQSQSQSLFQSETDNITTSISTTSLSPNLLNNNKNNYKNNNNNNNTISTSTSTNHYTQSQHTLKQKQKQKKSPSKLINTFPKVTYHMKGSMLENDLESKSPSKFQSTRFSTEDSISIKKSMKLKDQSQLNSQLKSKSKSNLSYDTDLAYHLHTETKDTTNNPFREKERDSKSQYSAAKSLTSLRNHFVDPKDYSKDNVTLNYGKYVASIKEPYVSNIPSTDKVNKALVQLARRMIVCYDTKVVETGAALKALQDLRHPTPGIAAIVDLNRSFCDAASLNPSPWQLSRQQFAQILHEKIPWFDMKAITRLTSAYDPHRSGVVKFVRVSAALMVGNRPAMSILMSQLTRDPDNVDKTGNVFILRLLHGLYEDCNGGVVEQAISSLDKNSQFGEALNIPKSEGVGIKLEDIGELLSAACSCLEDEIEMQKLASEVVQVLFEEGQKKDLAAISSPNSRRDKKRPITRSTKREMLLFGETESISTNTTQDEQYFDYTIPTLGSEKPIASVVLKHSTLKGVRSIPNVNQNDFVKCVTRHPTLMSVFDKQLTKFRELMLPYITKGTISFEDSLLQQSTYGSRPYY